MFSYQIGQTLSDQFASDNRELRKAAAKGAKIGRPQTTKDDIPPSFYRHYASYKNGTLNISELSRVCNISRTTAYKYLSLLEN